MDGKMDAGIEKVLSFLGGSKRIFYIPVYQRNYNWKEEQCKKLFWDIENILKSNKDGHFIGSIVYVDIPAGPNFREFIIIDGQQRITTLLILLKALHDVSDDQDFKIDILNDYLINTGKKIDEKYRIKLKTVENDSATFNNLISDKNFIDEYEEIEEKNRVYENFKLFKELIEKSHYSVDDIFLGISKLNMVFISLNNGIEDPQLIFESLNSTGLDLTPGDLIRNYLLMGHRRETQEELYENYWKKIEEKVTNSRITDFIKDYLTLKLNKTPNKNRIYETFKEFYEEAKKENLDNETLLEEILRYANYYNWIIFSKSPEHILNESLNEFSRLFNTVVYPFLLYILNKYVYEKVLSLDETIEIIDFIKSYIVRRAICDKPSNGLNKYFPQLIREIDKNNSIGEEFKNLIMGKILSKNDTTIFPKDKEFKEKFESKNLYKFKLEKFILEMKRKKLKCLL